LYVYERNAIYPGAACFSLMLWPADVKPQSGFLMPPGVRQVEWPFDYVNNFIVVTVTLNGTIPLKMIFDTGANIRYCAAVS
jgi:hypothetical protein